MLRNPWDPGLARWRAVLGRMLLLGSIGLGCSSDLRAGGPSSDGGAADADPAAFVWSQRAPLPVPRTELGLVAVGNQLYALGGYSGSMLSRVERFDPATNSWTRVADMHVARRSFAVGVIDGKIYVGPGLSYIDTENGTAVKTTEAYDPATDTWTDRAPCPIGTAGGRGSFSAGGGAVHGRLYVVVNNGFSPLGGPTSFTFEYDPLADSWAYKSPVPFAHTHFATATMNGLLYVLGSDDSGAELASYDSAADVWMVLAGLPTAWHAGFGTANGKFYSLGGVTGSTHEPTDAVYEYDPTSDRWMQRGAVDLLRQYPGTAELAGHLYLVGGDTVRMGGVFNGAVLAAVEDGAPK